MIRNMQYEVVVVGGGAAGVAAAVGAAQAGAKTILLERNPYLGGEGVHAGINSFGGFYTRGENPILVTGGVGALLRKELVRLGHPDTTVLSRGGNHMLTFDPEYMKLALDNLIQKSGAEYLYHCYVMGVKADHGRIIALECMDDEGRFWIEGENFVDASGESVISHICRLEVLIGDGEGKRQVATLAMRLSGVSPDIEITRASLEKAIKQGKEAGIPYLSKERGGIMRRGRSSVAVLLLASYAHQDLSCKTLTEAEVLTRRQARSYVEALQRFHPGMEHICLIGTGPNIGIREGRRTRGEKLLTGEDVWNLKKFPDGVARCGWSPEIHTSTQVLDTYEKLPDYGWFHIPVGALKAKEIQNLWCGGRTISTDSIAYGAVRVMGCGFATGHAAGVAAAISKGGIYNTGKIQQELLRQGAII